MDFLESLPEMRPERRTEILNPKAWLKNTLSELKFCARTTLLALNYQPGENCPVDTLERLLHAPPEIVPNELKQQPLRTLLLRLVADCHELPETDERKMVLYCSHAQRNLYRVYAIVRKI